MALSLLAVGNICGRMRRLQQLLLHQVQQCNRRSGVSVFLDAYISLISRQSGDNSPQAAETCQIVPRQ
ncbi:hypothetical protein QUB08_30290 [Microcoleus sp. BR0-C5]